jgi:hypothetical protein
VHARPDLAARKGDPRLARASPHVLAPRLLRQSRAVKSSGVMPLARSPTRWRRAARAPGSARRRARPPRPASAMPPPRPPPRKPLDVGTPC